jgi:hypothetical protein
VLLLPNTRCRSVAINGTMPDPPATNRIRAPGPYVFGTTLVADGEPPIIEIDAWSRSCLQDWKVRGQVLTGWQLTGRWNAASAKAFVGDGHWCSLSW